MQCKCAILQIVYSLWKLPSIYTCYARLDVIKDKLLRLRFIDKDVDKPKEKGNQAD